MATKEDWVSVVEQEEGELLVIQLIDEVIHNSHQVLFKKHIDVQILPFAVDFAKNTILDLINYHFFSRDPGNNDNVLWIPDDEPEPIQTDSWACASVPVRTLGDHFVRTNPEGVIELLDPAVKIPAINSNLSKAKKLQTPKQKVPQVELVKVKPAKAKARRKSASENNYSLMKNTFRANDNTVNDAEKMISEDNRRLLSRIATTEKEEGTVKNADYTFDPNGKVMFLTSSPPWNQNVGVKVRVLGHEHVKPPKENTDTTLQLTKNRINRMRHKNSKNLLMNVNVNDTLDGFDNDPSLNIPSLIDTMKIAAGVTLKEGESVRAGAQIKKTSTKTIKYPVIQDKSMFEVSQLAVLDQIIMNSKPMEVTKESDSLEGSIRFVPGQIPS